MWFKFLFWVYLVWATTSACTNDYFAPGYEYHYKYMVSVDGSAVGTTNRRTGLDISCDVQILTKEQCQYILKLDHCNLSELGKPSADGISLPVRNVKTDQFSLELSKYPAYFSLVNGSVEHLEFHRHDTLVAENFKRGVITSTITQRRYPAASSNIQELQVRDDVQGSCGVEYVYDDDDDDKFTMNKDVKTCKFPGKPDWHYSPWSLFWNMSFIQTMWINSSAHCSYEFSRKDRSYVELRSSICRERHAIMLESTRDTEISVQTNIKQKLTFHEASPLTKWENKEEEKYFATSIHFQYEKTEEPARKSANADAAIKGLLDEVSMDLEKQQDNQITVKFGELIDLLRNTPDLDKLTKELVECTQSKECITAIKVHKMQIYRDALLQCHHLHCIRNFKHLVAIPKPIRSIIVSDEYLYNVFDSLMKSQVKDPAYVKEIKEICSLQPKMTSCVFSLASLTNALWVANQWDETSQIPKDFEEVLNYVLNLPNTDVLDRVLQLKAIGTIGYLIELHKPDAVDWLFKLNVSSFDRVPRIEASRRFSSSDKLYEKLMGILKNDQLFQDERVSAYRILVETWQSEPKLSTDIKLLFLSTTTDQNLKFFIFSHLYSLTKSSTAVDARFARNLVEDLNAERWGSHLQKDTTNSAYNDNNYWWDIPFLPRPMNQLGLSVESTRLHDAKLPSPFYVKDSTFLHFLGKDFEFLESSIFFQGVDWLRELFDRQDESYWYVNVAKEYLKKPATSTSESSELPSDVDPAIVRRLQEIRKEYTDNQKNKNPFDFLLSIKDNGDDAAFITTDILAKFWSDKLEHLTSPRQRQSFGNEPTTTYVKVVEALNLVPTLSGIPLNWTTDAYYLSKSELLNSDINPLKWDYRVGVSASLQNRMIIDIPGYTNCGVQSFSSASLAFNGLLEATYAPTFTLSFGFPNQPAHISLTRNNYLIRGYSLESIPDWDVKRVKQDWCTDYFVSSVGMKLCHSRSYPQVTERLDKPWTLMAGDSQWNYTLTNAKDRRTVITLNLEIWKETREETQLKVILVNNQLRTDDSSFQEKQIFTAVYNDLTKRVQLHLGVKNSTKSYASLDFKTDKKHEIQVLGTVKLDPMTKYEANFTFHRINDLVPAATLKNRIIKGNSTKKVQVDGEEITASITTHTGQGPVAVPSVRSYSFKYRYARSPFLRKTDYAFNYVCGVPCNTWAKGILPSELWDDRGNARLEYHQDRLLDQRYSFDNFQRVTTDKLETPKSLYVLKRTGEFNADVRNFLHYNVSKFSLPNRVQQTYLNISIGSSRGLVDGFNVTHHLATLSVPDLVWSAQLKRKQREGQQQTYFAILRESNSALFGLTAAKSEAGKSGLEFDLVYKDRSAPERPKWSNYKTSCEISYPFINSGIQHITYSGELIRTDEKKWSHLFTLKSTQLQSEMHSETAFNRGAEKMTWLHKSTFDVTPIQVEARYYFDMTKLFSDPPTVVHFNAELNASNYNTRETTDPAPKMVKIHSPQNLFSMKQSVVTGLEPCEDQKNGYGAFNFTLDVPINPIADTTLNGHFCTGQTFFTANLGSRFYEAVFSGQTVAKERSFIADFTKKEDFKSMLIDVNTKFVTSKDYPSTPAFLEISIPELDRKYYFMLQYYINSYQLIVTACRQKECFDLESDPDAFIAQNVWDFYDEDYIYQTLIVNNRRFGHAEIIIKAIVGGTVTRQHVDGSLEILYNKLDFSSLPTNPLLDSLIVLIDPVIQYGRQVKKINLASTVQGRTISTSHIGWFWNYFDGAKQTRQLIFHHIEQYANGDVWDTDDGLGKIYMSDITKLFIITPDYGLPGITPATYRDFLKYFTIAPQRYQFKEVFYIAEYNRLAVMFDNRNVLTFDKYLHHDVKSTYKQCPYLLTSDVRLNRFAVYIHNEDLHILLPEVRIKISGTGSVYINGSSDSYDLPYSDRNGDTRVLRQENVVTVYTEHNLIIKCVNGQQFCIFYTNDENYARLAGLLGDNNNIEEDDKRPLKKWMLGKDDSCLNVPAIDTQVSDISCYGVFGGGYYKNSVIFQGYDLVNTGPFQVQCEDEGGDACASASAYVAMSSAYEELDIQGALPQCLNCNGHEIGSTWREKVDKSLELVYVVNDEHDELLTVELIKNLQSLSTAIGKEFKANGFQKVKFGVMSVAEFGSTDLQVNGYHREHRINGKQMYTTNEFSGDSLANIEQFSHSMNISHDSDLIFDALVHASDYSFDSKAVHMVALVTHEDDEDEFKPENMQNVLEEFEEKGITLYTFSNFPSLRKQSKIVGVRGDGFAFPQPKNKELFVDYPKGQFAKLSSATRGAVWLLSKLETKSATTKTYFQTVAEEMLARAKQDTRQCRSCACAVPEFYQPETRCHFVSC